MKRKSSQPSPSDTPASAIEFIVGVAKDQRFSDEYLGNVVRSWLSVLERTPLAAFEVKAYRSADCICEHEFDLTVPGDYHNRACPLRHR